MSYAIRSNRYQVYLGNDTFYQIGKYLNKHHQQEPRIFILVDENTRQHCLPLLQQGVLAMQQAQVLEIPAGEKSKSIEMISRLWNELTQHGADRRSMLVNLGGGVVMDTGGFTAATYMRGIEFINIPTTLLAMVDASVGGKNGINVMGIKNHVGTFTDPGAVFVSPVFLKTLPVEEIRCGFAEVIKHALISDLRKWNAIKDLASLDGLEWTEIIKESIWTKNKIVNSDYRDRHARKSLNFGHTVGHALESVLNEGNETPLKHGEAIAIGMLAETWLSERTAGLSPEQAQEIYSLIRAMYPRTVNFSNDALIEAMRSDKKNHTGKIHFALIHAVGKPALNQSPGEDLIRQSLDFTREQILEMS